MEFFEQLEELNKRLPTIEIKGKKYVMTNARILGFWELFPNGRIVTKQLTDDGSRCEFACQVYRDEADELPTVVSHAYEVRTGAINSTSYLENCETSAIGRALGFLGIGATESIASADEVMNAIERQEANESRSKATAKGSRGNGSDKARKAASRAARITDIVRLKTECIENGIHADGIDAWFASKFGETPLNKLTDPQLFEVSKHLETLIKDMKSLKEEEREGDANVAE